MNKEEANRLSQIAIVIAILSYKMTQQGYDKYFIKPEFVVEVLKKIYVETTIEEVERLLFDCNSAYTKILDHRNKLKNPKRENGISVSSGVIKMLNSIDIQPQNLARIPFLL